jgi:hypothetical protein
LYLASALEPQIEIRPSSRIIYFDGSTEVIEHATHEFPAGPPSVLSTPTSRYLTFFAMLKSILSFPWWTCDYAGGVFHALVRLKGSGREGLLVDCGAVSNLTGDKWVSRAAKLAAEHGQGTTITSRATQSVEGVGSGASTIDKHAKIPICLASGNLGTFETAVVSGSDLPALMGLEGLERNRALIDVYGKRLIYIGHGGYELRLSPGSLSMQLEKVPSGHLLLPASEWDKMKVSSGPMLAHLVQH